MGRGTCSEPECAGVVVARGKCRKHYVYWYRRRPGGPKCAVAACEMPTYSSGYCATHHHHWKAKGDPEHADKRRARSRRFDGNGYVVVRQPDHPHANSTWVLEHRAVMEQAIGRYLTPDESVHHKNGQRADNRLENLELWVRYQPAGQRAEDLVTFARDVLARYGNLYP